MFLFVFIGNHEAWWLSATEKGKILFKRFILYFLAIFSLIISFLSVCLDN